MGAFDPFMGGTSIEFTTLLDLCRERHRRIILAVLAAEDRSLTVNDLTKAIVKHNHHAPLREISGEESLQIQLSLIHTHIPKLEDLSIVTYDQERQLVEPTSQFDRLRPQLSAIVEADPDLDSSVAL